jgi:hypothetical protein
MAEETQQQAPTFTEEQQAFINQIIDGRIGKTKAQAEKDKADAIAAAVADKEAEIVRLKESIKKGGGGDIEAERAQLKELLDAEKRNTQQQAELAKKHLEKFETVSSENLRILKGQAIREAMDAQETFTFVDPAVVRQLVDASIHYEAESGTWVVKDGNLVRQNNSMQPMSVKEYMAEFAAKHPYLVKGTTKGGSGSSESTRSGSGMGKVNTRADLKTPKDKSDFISKFGYDAFAKLPAK